MFKDLKQYNMKINRFPYFFVWVFLCKLCCSWWFDSLLSIIKVLVVKFLSLGILLQWKFRQFSLKVGIDFYNLQGNQIEEKIEKIPNSPGYVARHCWTSDKWEDLSVKSWNNRDKHEKESKRHEETQWSCSGLIDKGTFRYLSEWHTDLSQNPPRQFELFCIVDSLTKMEDLY